MPWTRGRFTMRAMMPRVRNQTLLREDSRVLGTRPLNYSAWSPRAGAGSPVSAQHRLHPVDLCALRLLDRLRVVDRRPELALLDLVPGHLSGTLVVLDHPLQPQPVELGSARSLELVHLSGAEHAGHLRVGRAAITVRVGMVSNRLGYRLVPRGE